MRKWWKAEYSDGGGQGSIVERWSGKVSLTGDIVEVEISRKWGYKPQCGGTPSIHISLTAAAFISLLRIWSTPQKRSAVKSAPKKTWVSRGMFRCVLQTSFTDAISSLPQIHG